MANKTYVEYFTQSDDDLSAYGALHWEASKRVRAFKRAANAIGRRDLYDQLLSDPHVTEKIPTHIVATENVEALRKKYQAHLRKITAAHERK